MVAPIDYSVDVQSPFVAATQGLQLGAGVREMQQQQQQQEAAKAAAQKQAADLASFSALKNPTAQDYASFIAKYPQFSEQAKRGWDILNPAQQQSRLSQMTQVYSALNSSKPDVAVNLLKDQATALRNSGDIETANHVDAMAKVAEVNPDYAKLSTGTMLSAIPGGDKVIESISKIGTESRAQQLAPVELRAATAKAGTAESEQTIKAEEAKNAPQTAALELQKKGWDVKKIQEEINASKENTRLKAMEVAMQKELNPLKKQELQSKINEANQTMADKIREKATAAESGAATIDNMLNTADRILKNPSLDKVLGSIQGRLPASLISDNEVDAVALIDTLGSQAFLAQIPSMKGTGSLTEREGDKLQSSLANLSRVQSEEQFKYNLKEAQRLMKKARENLSKKTGIPLGAPDRPNAPAQTASFGPAPAGQQPAAPQKNVVVDF